MKLRIFLVVSIFAAIASWAGTTYTVKSGDSLDGIARKHNVSVADIVKANAMSDPDKLSVGQTLKIPDASGGTSSGGKYTVQSGDTLGAIASDLGVSIIDLTNINKISDPNEIKPGMTLTIPKPGTSVSATTSVRYPLSPAIKTALDKQKVVPGKWRYIVIHHSATRNGSAKSMENYHRFKRRMENGLAYHFVIGNGLGMRDGEIAIGNRWKRQIKGGHLASNALNEKSIGICLVGNFENSRPTTQQMKSLYALVTYLQARCKPPSDAVKLHRQINTKPTKCPGKNFPGKALDDNT